MLGKNVSYSVTSEEKLNINKSYKNGLSISELIIKFGRAPTTIYSYIDDDNLYRSLNRIRKKRTGRPHKPHKPHKKGLERKKHNRGPAKKPYKRGSERKKRITKKNAKYFEIARKVADLYIKHGSSTKVQKELLKDGIKMTPATILKRVREIKNK